jgi:3-methyladenine DNA glycosylase AlkC
MEPFKNFFSRELVGGLARHLARVWPAFPVDRFVRGCLIGWEHKELKERSSRITEGLCEHLPAEFSTSAEILLAILHPETDREIGAMQSDERGVAGWVVMPLADFISRRGVGHLDLAMESLRQMTQRFSAEFAIRPLIAAHPAASLSILQRWKIDPNAHVRRLVSEGSRPRLPWGLRLNQFVCDPAPLVPLLAALRNDPSDYVRRSVANNLNDISKDHPLLVLELASDWIGQTTATDQLLKHACRGLLKAGSRQALSLFGVQAVALQRALLVIDTPRVSVGGWLRFRFTAELPELKSGASLRMEYEIQFLTGTGRTSRKVFKISERPWQSGADSASRLDVVKEHSFVDRAIRRHYPGRHVLTVILNGARVAEGSFDVVVG